MLVMTIDKPLKTSSLQLVLAESNPTISRPLLHEMNKDSYLNTTLCSSYEELIQILTHKLPDLLILGTLEELSCLEVYRKCRSQWQDLPVILLANQVDVHQYFRKWARDRGISDVISSHPKNFRAFHAAIQRVVQEGWQQKQSAGELDKASTEEFIVEELTEGSIQRLEEIFAPLDAPETPSEVITGKEALSVISELTAYSMNYFGPLAIGNYWRKAHASTVEGNPWLKHWTVNHNGKINYAAEEYKDEPLTTEQIHSLQAWIQAFLLECQRVIVDFSKLLRKKQLSPPMRKLIFPNNLS